MTPPTSRKWHRKSILKRTSVCINIEEWALFSCNARIVGVSFYFLLVLCRFFCLFVKCCGSFEADVKFKSRSWMQLKICNLHKVHPNKSLSSCAHQSIRFNPLDRESDVKILTFLQHQLYFVPSSRTIKALNVTQLVFMHENSYWSVFGAYGQEKQFPSSKCFRILVLVKRTPEIIWSPMISAK